MTKWYMDLFSDNHFREANHFVSQFVSALSAINHFALFVLACSKSRYGFVLVGIEIGAIGLDGVYLVLVEEGEELLINEVDPFFQSVVLLFFLPLREGLRVGLYRALEIIDER